MNACWTIFKKEVKGYYKTPGLYIIGFLVALVLSWVFPALLKQFADQSQTFMMQPGVPKQMLNIHYGVFLRELSYLNLILIFLVPALTMKLFAEEKKLRTFDLLLTSPVTSWQIVLGKYFAALVAVLGILGVALSYPLVTKTVADVQFLQLGIAFVGLLFVAAVYASMNLFSSALTENGIVAYVLSVIFNIAVWFVGIGAEMADTETARKVFEHISLNTHLTGFVEGTVRTNGLVFFVSLIALFTFLSERVVEATRWR